MKIEEAAALLGARPGEIVAVEEIDGGITVLRTSGTSWIVLDADHPDAEGKTGLMLLEAPNERSLATVDGVTTWAGQALYVPHPDPAADEIATFTVPATPAEDAAPAPAPKPSVKRTTKKVAG